MAEAQVLGATPQMLDVNGKQFRVIYRPGKSSQPPLLLLNGFGCSAEIFQPLVDRLDPDLGIICLDPPGIGGSPPPRLPYRLSGYACRIGKILDQLAVDSVDVLGISWGGTIAQQFALQNPRRCRRLILVSTGAAPLLKPNLTTLREVIWPRRFDPVYGQEVAAQLYGGKVKQDRSLLKMMRNELPNQGGEFFQQLAIAGWTSLPYLPLLRQRTLVMAGDDDQMVPAFNARLIELLMPHARRHIFNDGHLGLLTSAEELSPVIQSFLTAA